MCLYVGGVIVLLVNNISFPFFLHEFPEPSQLVLSNVLDLQTGVRKGFRLTDLFRKCYRFTDLWYQRFGVEIYRLVLKGLK